MTPPSRASQHSSSPTRDRIDPPLTLYTVQGAHHAAPAVAVSVQIETVLARHAAELAPDKGVIPARITAPDGRAWIVAPGGTLTPETTAPSTPPTAPPTSPAHDRPAEHDDAHGPIVIDRAGSGQAEDDTALVLLGTAVPIVALFMIFVSCAESRGEAAVQWLLLAIASTAAWSVVLWLLFGG